MSTRPARRDYYGKSQARQARRRNSAVSARQSLGSTPKSRRGVAPRNVALPFSPPEDWHEPSEEIEGYEVLVQPAGEGYRHVLKPSEVRQRLDKLPETFLRDLEVVQFSRMTRKKQSLPCYGMQWGPALYLYPIDESLTEHFGRAPSPDIYNETRMFGGHWREEEGGAWTLHWTVRAIKDFYLNNILIHELGHLLDERNTSYTDRERFAEWFATEYGYRWTGGAEARRPRRRVRRRHHRA
ncbi:hypothetical protein MalM25_23470 [Planctomycetes bacterium MalM25]|nr:hypothetical protein MalM25_23470 [Planctomycetes bacterium MalM25]